MSEESETAKVGIGQNAPVIIYLHSPREKLWGLVQEINQAGVYMRGIDLNTFDDWTRMLARGERNIGLTQLFFPMWRVERITLDERVDDIPSLAERFQENVGLSIEDYFSK
ncbi:MAG: hypothetical protein AB1757_21885 [Acidobacteriota bacterium]